MNKKGFVLMETIVVIVVVSVALLTIFSSYNKILSKLRTENKYDTSEYIYMTKYIKDYMQDQNIAFNVGNLCSSKKDENMCETKDIEDLSKRVVLKNMKELYNIEKIYLLTNINKFDVKMNDTKKNSSLFDAYMIDYIKKLDVRDQDKLLIVEYKRPAKDTNNEDIRMTCSDAMKENGKCPILYETYISSLEWD